jgi:transcriptional regulator with XRE-family HTH domain
MALHHLAVNLRRLRAERRLKQVELAHRAGISQQRLSLYEAGLEPKPSDVDRLAAALGVTSSALFRRVRS